MISLVSVLVGLAVLAFVLRVFARRKKRVALGIDDYLCFVANTLMMGMLIELILCEPTIFYLVQKRRNKPTFRAQGVPLVAMGITHLNLARRRFRHFTKYIIVLLDILVIIVC